MIEGFKRKGSDEESISISEPPIVSSVSTTIFDPKKLVEELTKKGVGDVLVPDDDTISLLTVQDWIPMPKAFQELMSCPGIPCGHVTEVIGKKDSGKTTFATQALIECQKMGGIACLLDTENKFSLKRAENMGLDIRKLIIIQAITLEQAFEKFIKLVEVIDKKPEWHDRSLLVVWDSLGQTTSEAELDPKVTDFAMAAAKVIKGGLRKIRAKIARHKIAFLIINQVYANMNAFGKKTTAYGGSGPEYAASIILEFSKVGRARPKGVKAADGHMAGTKVKIECEKNHIGQPFKILETMIDWRGFAFDRDIEYAPKE